MKQIAGYVRVSRVAGREGPSFQSPDAQEEAIRAHCSARRLRVVEVVRELDRSGGTMERPELQRLVREVEDGKLAGIVVWRLDRFARTLVGGIKTLEQIHASGGFVQTVEGGIDTSNAGGAMGELQLNLLLTLAQWERAVRAEGLESAKQRAVARGVHIGPAPVGYVRPGSGKSLALDEEKAEGVRAAFELRARGATFGEVARLLDDKLPGGPSGRGAWHRGTVTRLLSNRAYLGEARGGNGPASPAAHPPIVTQEVFDTVQALAHRREQAPAPTSARSLLAGIARCGHCGYALDRNKVGGGYIVYRCRGRSATGLCESPTSAMAHALEQLVADAVLERLSSYDVAVRRIEVDVSDLHDRLAVARAKRAPFEDPDFVLQLGLAGATRALAKVDDEIEGIERELADVVGVPGIEESSLTVRPTAAAWSSVSTDDRRAVVASMIDAVAVSRRERPNVSLRDRVAIYWKGDKVPLARPSRGRRRNRTEVEPGMHTP